ncbi:hypothetical protein [Thalassobacillus sp. CUG 92003]|uniref:hypothetical protein n=1 Tax=Thalassobacillus sp. CUG 92003 TaxID=2736641 RepID=UPI0015E72FE0|nr:hypothetical protein [Thalassobacillus sp. CUG 92003]
MKRFIRAVLPFALLFLAMVFMTEFKQMERLDDLEQFQINSFLNDMENSETNTNNTSENNLNASEQSSQTEENEQLTMSNDTSGNEGNEQLTMSNDTSGNEGNEYTTEKRNDKVIVYNSNGETVTEIPQSEWEQNKQTYANEYSLN